MTSTQLRQMFEANTFQHFDNALTQSYFAALRGRFGVTLSLLSHDFEKSFSGLLRGHFEDLVTLLGLL